ncbi:glycine--tRNA ligase [archaeon]|nr:glycine--tRNA ligase [archaeon]
MKDKVLDIAKRRGFIWGPSPNIYSGGVSGFYDWGPLGKLLKNKVESIIRKTFSSYNFWEVECPTIMPKSVWEASGHYENFTDPITKCLKCKLTYRADDLIKELYPKEKVDGLNEEQLTKLIEKKQIKCPKCKSSLSDVNTYNLMMKTTVGSNTEAFLRPETATTTYLLYPEYYRFFRTKLPFGVFQIGKAYRNEISPRQHVLRTREFTQAEAQLFILPDQEKDFDKFKEIEKEKLPLMPYGKTRKITSLKQAISKKLIKKEAYAYCIYIAYEIAKQLFDESKIRLRQHNPKEMSHYADDAWDLEIETERFGWFEVCGIHDRTGYDLKRHSEFARIKLEKPANILEIAFGLERPTYSLLETAFKEDKIRSWLQFPLGLSPIDVAIFPLVKKDKLPEKAKEVFTQVERDFVAIYDEAGSIGKMYRRMDEIGTTLTCTIDHQTLKDNTVTLREITSMQQIRVKVEDLNDIIKKILTKELEFKKAGKLI